jgi:hypothetical protein
MKEAGSTPLALLKRGAGKLVAEACCIIADV